MKVKNISNDPIYLPFISYTIDPGETKIMDDSYYSHPQFISLMALKPSVIYVSEVGSSIVSIDHITTDQYWAIYYSDSPDMSNPFATSQWTKREIAKHSSIPEAHHSNKNDPDINQKEAMDHSLSPSGINPFGTINQIDDKILASIMNHLATSDHNPSPINADEANAMHNSVFPSGLNPFGTISHISSLLANALSIHAGLPTIHHTNVNDPSADQKAALTNASPAINSGNPVISASSLSTHVGNAVAHHTNANDPSADQKAAMNSSSPLPTGTNPFVTSNDTKMLTTDQKAACTNATPTPNASNPFVTSNDTRLLITHHLSSDQKASMDNSIPLPTGVNPIVTIGHTNMLSANQKAGIANASPAIDAGNPVISASSLSTHVSNATAHHTNVNDPSVNQKAALTNASPAIDAGNPVISASSLSTHVGNATAHHTNVNDPNADQKAAMNAANVPGLGNPFAVISDITSHTNIATAHHSNANDPSSDQKAAMTNASPTPNGTNPFVTNTDTRMSNDRYPTAHAASHSTGSDTIQSATVSQIGLMTSTHAIEIGKLSDKKNDIILKLNGVTQVDCIGIFTKEMYIAKELSSFSATRSVITSDHLIAADGTDTGNQMAANTLYYLYVSNSQATYAPNSFRACTVAPTFDSANNKLMLATSGNGNNWAFVGWANTAPAAIEFSDEFAIASYYNPKLAKINKQGPSVVGPVAAINTWYNITGFEHRILLPPDWVVEIKTSIPMKSSDTGTLISLGISNGIATTMVTAFEEDPGNRYSIAGGTQIYQNNGSVPTYNEYAIRHQFNDVSGSASDTTRGNMSIIRYPN